MVLNPDNDEITIRDHFKVALVKTKIPSVQITLKPLNGQIFYIVPNTEEVRAVLEEYFDGNTIWRELDSNIKILRSQMHEAKRFHYGSGTFKNNAEIKGDDE